MVNQNQSVLEKLLVRFELQVGKGSGYEEVNEALIRKHIHASCLDFLRNELVGWLHKELVEKIKTKQPARIFWEHFDREFKVLFEKIRFRELIDFTICEPISEGSKEEQANLRPTYLKQLEAIKLDHSDLIEAITNFLSAKVNRDKWIEAELIDLPTAGDFERKLISFWRNKRRQIEIRDKSYTEEDRGKLLFSECQTLKETIREVSPPSSTISGTYHALANDIALGWHPNWEEIFKK